MHEMRERNELCDVTLKVNNQNFHAHKVCLAFSSLSGLSFLTQISLCGWVFFSFSETHSSVFAVSQNLISLQVVLAGCSPYLRAMFTNGMLETDKRVVEIHGIEAQTMNMLLEFMYKGTLP